MAARADEVATICGSGWRARRFAGQEDKAGAQRQQGELHAARKNLGAVHRDPEHGRRSRWPDRPDSLVRIYAQSIGPAMTKVRRLRFFT